MRKTLWVALAGALSAGALADDNDLINPDRPGIADGSTVVGRHYQIETGYQQELHDGGHTRLIFIPTLLRFGVNSNWELRIEGAPFSYSDSFGVRSTGYQPISAGAKYHFMDAKGTKCPSLGFIGRVFPAIGSAGFQTTATTGDVRLAGDWNLNDQWELNPNLGVAEYQDGNGNLFTAGLFAMTLNFNPTPVLNFFVDTGIQGPEQQRGKTSVIVDVGVAYILGKNVQLDFSVGNGVSGVTSPHPFVGAGVSVRF
ncbi:MAG TPA: transporter [Fimbriimonadaceae bacterium]|nr:transporter [Fimbriimonadaceae bacterium]